MKDGYGFWATVSSGDAWAAIFRGWQLNAHQIKWWAVAVAFGVVFVVGMWLMPNETWEVVIPTAEEIEAKLVDEQIANVQIACNDVHGEGHWRCTKENISKFFD